MSAANEWEGYPDRDRAERPAASGSRWHRFKCWLCRDAGCWLCRGDS